jgi:hypothetical protein
MRSIFILCILFSRLAWSSTCECHLNAFSPIHGNTFSYKDKVMTFIGNYHGAINVKSVHGCRQECVEMMRDKVDSDDLLVELKLRAQKMVDEETIGYNCTGTTTFKFPIEMRAYIGDRSLGSTYKSLEIVHVEKKCFGL